LLHYALRQAFAPRLLTVQPRDGKLALVAVNDHHEPRDRRCPGDTAGIRLGHTGARLAPADRPTPRRRLPPTAWRCPGYRTTPSGRFWRSRTGTPPPCRSRGLIRMTVID